MNFSRITLLLLILFSVKLARAQTNEQTNTPANAPSPTIVDTNSSDDAEELKEFLQEQAEQERAEFEEELAQQGIEKQDADELRVSTETTPEGKTLVLHVPETSPLTPQHVLYLGVRIGMMFPVGVEAVYQYKVDGLTRFHADAGVTTSHLIHSIEGAGAWHPRDGRAFYMGVRMKDTILFDPYMGYKGIFNPYMADHFFSIGPEIGWQKAMGKQKFILGTIALGVQKGFGQSYNLPFMPDIRLGLAVRIFKSKNQKAAD